MRRTTVVAAGLAVILSGCKMDVTPELFTSDIRAVAVEGEEDLTTPATVAIGMGSKDTCKKHAEKVSAILSEKVQGFSPRGCEGTGNDVMLASSIQIPLVTDTAAWQASGSMFGVLVQPLEQYDGAIGVFFLADAAQYELLNEHIRSEFYQHIDLADSRVKVVLSNDERGETRFTVNNVYFNGQPVQGLKRREHTLARRHDAEIVLSNVALSALVEGQPVATLLLMHP